MDLWQAYDRIDNHLNEKLLTIPPYPSVSGVKLKELLNSLEKPDLASGGLEGEILRMISSPWQRAYQIEYRFKPSKIFEDFMNVIESATYDLMMGNYVCSYLSLVPVVEAILRRWATENSGKINSLNRNGDFSIFKFERNLVKYLECENNKRNSNPKFQRWISNQIKYFDFIIKEVFYLRFKDSESGSKREFNRNRVLHLLEKVEDQVVLRDNNTRIFLLLDIMAELYLSLNIELYNKNTFYSNPEENIDFNLRWKIYIKSCMESISFTDMNIIQFAFFNEDKKLCLSEEQKNKLLQQKDYQIQILEMKNFN